MIDVDLFNCNHKNCTRVSHYFRTHTNSTSENMRTATLYNIALPVVWFPSIVFVLRRRRPKIGLYCDINMFTAAGGEKNGFWRSNLSKSPPQAPKNLIYWGPLEQKSRLFPPHFRGSWGGNFLFPPTSEGCGGETEKVRPPTGGGEKRNPALGVPQSRPRTIKPPEMNAPRYVDISRYTLFYLTPKTYEVTGDWKSFFFI